MIQVHCPTGCGAIRRPWPLRSEPVRCGNCTAWIAAPAVTEDGTLVEGLLLARPGEALRSGGPEARRTRRPVWLVVCALLFAAVIVLALALAATAHAAPADATGEYRLNGPVRFPPVDCARLVPTRVARKHFRGSKVIADDKGCQVVGRDGKPITRYLLVCAPAGTPKVSTGVVPPWGNAVSEAAPPVEMPYRMAESSWPWGWEVPCLLRSYGIEMTWPKFQGAGRDLVKVMEPYVREIGETLK